MAHPIHKHMHTFITKQNVKAAIRDDKAHMDYLKRDVKDDQRHGGKYKDENQTADEKHISKLAGDVKYDEKKEGLSRESAYQHAKNLEKYNPVDDRAGVSRYKKEGMSAYSKIQEQEFAREKDGYTSVKHQREVGTSYFDAVSNTISSGKSSTTAMDGSTESEQF